jgi:hypothetical protein
MMIMDACVLIDFIKTERDAMDTFERAREKSHTDSHTEDDQQKKGQSDGPDNPLI